MGGFGELGKILIALGGVMAAIGVFLLIGERIPWVGRFPGDILIRKGKFTFYFPIVTCLLISFVLTLLFSLFRK